MNAKEILFGKEGVYVTPKAKKPKVVKPISANKRGKINEKRTHEWLEKRGFIVHTVRQAQFGKGGNDLFGLWDHVAICDRGNAPMLAGGRYVQVLELDYNNKHWTIKNLSIDFYESVWVQTKTNCKPTNGNAKEHRKFPGIKLWFNWVTDKDEPEIYRLTEVEK